MNKEVLKMLTQAEIDANLNTEPSKVQKFYEGARIFITGGSGFLGKLLIQKLIRDCSDLSKIYLLVRSKKGKTSEQRFEEMFQDSVFDRMIREQPNYTKKIILLSGDLEQLGLGLKESDRKLLSNEVDIIFHLAATVRFDEKIKKATSINLRGSKDVIELAKTMKYLKAFIYVSTAYSHCNRKQIDEQFYETPISADRLLQITEKLNDDELDVLTPKLISGGWPNTYTYTKACAENYIRDYGKGLPIAVVRPSMIISTYKDPVDGWINNYYGPIGISLAGWLGLLHCIQMKLDNIIDVIPGDYVINNIIVAACHVGNTFKAKEAQENSIVYNELQSSNEIPTIFHCLSSNESLLTYRQFEDMNLVAMKKWITVHAVWYYFVFCHHKKYFVKFLQLFLHRIPVHIIDFILVFRGKNRKMVKIYSKIENLHDVTTFFVIREWEFGNNNTQALWNNLSSTDRKLFPFSMKELNWSEFFQGYIKGIRIYLLKDPLETVPKALAKYRKLKIAHYTLVTIFCLVVFGVVFEVSKMLFILL